MFTKSQIGDPVWSCEKGWGRITKMYKEWDDMLCLAVEFPFHQNWRSDYKQKTGRVKNDYGDKDVLYHNPMKVPKEEYTPPIKKDIPIDTKMIVSKMWIGTSPVKRYFSHYDEFDGVYCFSFGQTSFSATGIIEHYDNWEIVE